MVVDAFEVSEADAAAFERAQTEASRRGPREREWFAVATEYVKVDRYNCGKEDTFGFVLLVIGLGGFGLVAIEPLLAFPSFMVLYGAFYTLVMRRFADGKFNWCCSCVFFCLSCNTTATNEGEEAQEQIEERAGADDNLNDVAVVVQTEGEGAEADPLDRSLVVDQAGASL